jgi:NAD(P)-dependent dehydrogenase (short-subunit alcohol dehydrogenase family)
MPTPSESFDLSGRTALVTGGSRGLGRETVLALAEAGADVMISSRRLESCDALAEEVRERTGARAETYACHVGHWEELEGLVEATYGAFGKLDVLVNNAGMSPLYESPSQVSEQLWDKVLDVNLKGPFRLTALVGERMARDGGGSIINVSSVAATQPNATVIPYAAAKAGVNGLTLSFCRAFGPMVRVNSILPGTFLTDVSQHWDMEEFEKEAQGFALQRGADPVEIVGAMLYLASDASSYMTGSLLTIDGGFAIPPAHGQVSPNRLAGSAG